MTSDKSRLEKDIEQQEACRKPRGVFLIVVLFAVAVGALGAYALQLKQELREGKKQKILLEQNCTKEKAMLLDKVKKLQQKLPYAGVIPRTAGTEAPLIESSLPTRFDAKRAGQAGLRQRKTEKRNE